MTDSRETVVGPNWEALAQQMARERDNRFEQLCASEAEADRLRAALRDLLEWAERREGDARLRRTEALEQARDALGRTR
jgi:hypothetical protein